MGFEGIELILTGPAEIADYWTDATIDGIRKRLDHYKLQVPAVRPLPAGGRRADQHQRGRARQGPGPF